MTYTMFYGWNNLFMRTHYTFLKQNSGVSNSRLMKFNASAKEKQICIFCDEHKLSKQLYVPQNYSRCHKYLLSVQKRVFFVSTKIFFLIQAASHYLLQSQSIVEPKSICTLRQKKSKVRQIYLVCKLLKVKKMLQCWKYSNYIIFFRFVQLFIHLGQNECLQGGWTTLPYFTISIFPRSILCIIWIHLSSDRIHFLLTLHTFNPLSREKMKKTQQNTLIRNDSGIAK